MIQGPQGRGAVFANPPLEAHTCCLQKTISLAQGCRLQVAASRTDAAFMRTVLDEIQQNHLEVL